MNIFYFCSDLFASVMAVSMVSLLETNKNVKRITFYIVDDGITKEKKEKLDGMLMRYCKEGFIREIVYLDAPDPNVLLKYPFESRYQMGHSYFRMCIGTLLPASVERVLCLDSDTLVCGDLTDLWNMDMQGNILAGVSDCMNVMKYRKQFQIGKTNLYCNAGVFLVNLTRWRRQKIEEKIIKRIFSEKGNVFFFEQTLMNWSCRGKILNLPPEYNVYTLFYAFKYENLLKWRRPVSFFTKQEIEKAKRNPKIIHFTRNFYMLSRPWVEGCDHPMTQEYLKYKRLTPWPELDKDSRNNRAKRKYELWHALPQGLLSVAASIVYNEIRPKMWWKNE